MVEVQAYTPVVTVVATALVPIVLWVLWSAARGGEEREPAPAPEPVVEAPPVELDAWLSELDAIVNAPDPVVEAALGDLDAVMERQAKLAAELAALDAELGYGPPSAPTLAPPVERAGPTRPQISWSHIRERVAERLGLAG